MAATDPFLSERYDGLHDTPMQRKFRKLCPMPIGVVFIEWPGMSDDDMRGHFRLMKQLGFTCLKQIGCCPGTDPAKIMHLALDEGIIPWWYGEAGWEEITDELLERLGIPLDSPMEAIRGDERMIRHQTQVLRQRIDGKAADGGPAMAGAGNAPPFAPVPHSVGTALAAEHHPRFVDWLKTAYGTPQAVAAAWNLGHYNIAPPGMDWQWTNWAQVAAEWPKLGMNEYRHLRDLLRFKADMRNAEVREQARLHALKDGNAPFRAGGEMGMFLPFAARATDMEGMAEAMRDAGSFYPSIHLAWHFEEVDFEVARCVYMQSSLAQDWFKGGWAATWESTGGPQQLSGGKAWNADAAKQTAGFTADAGPMTQLLLSYFAGGFKGVGLWCWNPRSAGWEAGEYSLLDRNQRPTPRAVRAGLIGQAARRFTDELWQARKEPLVGVFTDFDSEAIWAAIAHPNRDKYQHTPIHARIGVSRALINANVPFEYVTGRNLRAGLAGRYRVIYLPAVIALDRELLPILRRYVEEGGRLVMDLPGLWYDTYGRLMPTGPDSEFAKLFGCTLDDFQYSSNVPRTIDGHRLHGFVADMTATDAEVHEVYNDGQPAITEHHLGEGSAVILGCEASLACCKPGNAAAEALLIEHALGAHKSPYHCADAIVYRLSAPAADHYFFVNDGPAKTVVLDTRAYKYSSAIDAVSGEKIVLGAPIALEAHGGRWLRFKRRGGGNRQPTWVIVKE